ncbi:MAG: ABC transporter permease [Psychrosphaera sp.]|nr:ABC transporter permease [Psychrosphaera sp.]
MFEIRPILSAMLQHKSRAVLIILQMALTLAIVSNALFIIDERIQLMDRETGYAKEQLFSSFMIGLDGGADQSQQLEADEQMLRSIPGVIDAVVINHTPIAGSGSASSWDLVAKDEIGQFRSGIFRGDEHVLNTMGLTLLEGRNFTANEVEYGSSRIVPVVIINKSLADKLFPDGDALGKTIYAQSNPSKIVGIVGVMQGMWVNSSMFNDNAIFPAIEAASFNRYLVRTEPGVRQKVMDQFKDKLLELNRNRVIGNVKTLESDIERSYRSHNTMRTVLTVIISLLLFVTVVGIFGLSSFSVNQRTQQIGIRRSLGASKVDITRYFLVENCLMAVVGISLGCVLAMVRNYFMVKEYGVSQLNNAYVVGTMFGILLVSLMAVLVPALKAAQISPAIATR